MRTIINIILLTLALPVYGADSRWRGRRGEEQARHTCLDQARATGHRVSGVRSVDKRGKDNYKVVLRVQGVRDLLVCYYDEESGGAELQWSSTRR